MANADFRKPRPIAIMTCASSVAMGDLVFQSTTADNTAVTATDNLTVAPVFGIVTTKLAPTSCEVTYQGIVATSVARGKVFLGTDGKPTGTEPTTGYVQTLGVSFGNGTMNFQPELIRAKRSP